jgi:hypothetical protein
MKRQSVKRDRGVGVRSKSVRLRKGWISVEKSPNNF